MKNQGVLETYGIPGPLQITMLSQANLPWGTIPYSSYDKCQGIFGILVGVVGSSHGILLFLGRIMIY